MVLLAILDVLIFILGVAGAAYQGVYILASLFHKRIVFPDAPMDKRYAVLISARNEENVIGGLISSIHEQTYPSSLVDIWVVADNCTDGTAALVKSLGCDVVERRDQEHIGKGYALTYLLDEMIAQGRAGDYDAFFVFDADNLLDKHYIEEMNKAFQSGFRILTSYRNSVNLSKNWVSSGSALWFIRESRFVNNSRMLLGSSCHVGGTGFMFSQEIMRRNNGWKFHLLTEDLEFSMDSVLHGDRIGYCGTAILYDEQPVTFEQSWRQRLRWSKGFLQVFRYYGPRLIVRAVKERDFSAFDFTLLLCPFTVVTVVRYVLGVLFAVLGFISWSSLWFSLESLLVGAFLGMIGLMGLAALTVFAERDQIGATNKELFAYVLSFPIYMFSYVPISFQAIFARANWKPIEHRGVVDGGKVEEALPDTGEEQNDTKH
ncbi:glycosyltransferase family 2 protein [Bifidobacterium bombi]|uniref:Glycosyltransferase, group 2 family protein n=1 Tax=Bifidobacterium bombi DSM 19703 TaxID=1341695 RepID=A0A080N442_9BIFI|nr:glycosyltransferase family 2 protein [Bifidobacterium bombi]KFF31025.1 glycosyltransferase, group 2 family protein [Bifidobacterium bombi DSM 19703]